MRGTGQVDDSNPHLSLAAECLPLPIGGLLSVALSVGFAAGCPTASPPGR